MSDPISNIQLPQAAPDLLKERKWFGTPTDGLLLDFARPYTPPRWTLSHLGTSFAKRGDLHIVGGKAGHGKTAFMSQIMATILCGRFGGMQCEIQGEEPSVLYIDTEQSIDDTIAIKNRVCTLAGIPYDRPSDRFKVARLRETTDAVERYKQILQLIYDIKPTVVFIDGLLDIVRDYNDQNECSEIIRELMAVSTYYNQSMWCVLHENPMTDKLVGSLGSIAERKVTEVFIIRKHKGPHTEKRFATMPSVFFEVKQTKARGKDQEDWYFTVEDRALGWGVPVEIGCESDDPYEQKQRQLAIEVNDLLSQYAWTSRGATWTDLDRFFRSKGITSSTKISDYFNIAYEKGIIYKSDKKKIHYNGLKPEIPNDKAEDLPFGPSTDKTEF